MEQAHQTPRTTPAAGFGVLPFPLCSLNDGHLVTKTISPLSA